MDEFLNEMERFKDMTSAFTVADIAIVMGLSFVLSVAVTWVYRHTHQGTSYSQSYAQTLVVLGMVVSMIMLIIGSNLARAFSLVGALSIIRFRNAVKETRDVGFVFVVMAIGMACGTRFYALAGFCTAVLSAVILLMHKLDLFSKRVSERVLRVRLPSGCDYDSVFEPVFREYLDGNRLISVETTTGGALQELVYVVMLKATTEPQNLLDAVREVNGNQKVALIIGQQDVDL